ncbi:hypothetical protein M011DRAFT_484944 [Sporormia fimetaria CBS 119925]|uniref:Uncharacterized protein n=1 Tax=Sporormia fimetaria CBS 119925 TaxID=1340428 RepID=A0A6A6VK10_9PLEO|nr:hypothetical protein M011DRAFT_484944 [Sporormia fimetaria CBS 119925]
MSYNPDSVSNQGPFHARPKHSEPLEKGGHAIGSKHSPYDSIPTFSAQTMPAGTAPTESTYLPNPDLNNRRMYVSASDTLPGTDSAAVHKGLGHPGQGMTSSELHHDGQHGRKRQGLGTVGLNTGAAAQKMVDPHDPVFGEQRALDKDVRTGGTGAGGDLAEDRMPESAERVAALNHFKR